jgi:hypothetical protein
LGVLGQQDLPATITRAQQVAAEYAPLSDVPVLPALEIIATIARPGGRCGRRLLRRDRPGHPGAVGGPGDRRRPVRDPDLQPGRSDFLTQARRYTDVLTRPNVGLALDPEWRLGPGQRHLEQIGGVDAGEVNQVLDWLADLTAAHGLPQKVVVLHQFQLSMLRDEARIGFAAHPQVAVVVQMDGQGTPELKDRTWAAVTAAAPAGHPVRMEGLPAQRHPDADPGTDDDQDPHPGPDLLRIGAAGGSDSTAGSVVGLAGSWGLNRPDLGATWPPPPEPHPGAAP